MMCCKGELIVVHGVEVFVFVFTVCFLPFGLSHCLQLHFDVQPTVFLRHGQRQTYFLFGQHILMTLELSFTPHLQLDLEGSLCIGLKYAIAS